MLALKPGDRVDASASLNPLGPPRWLRQEISRWISALAHYPDPSSQELTHCIAEHHRCSPEQVVVGNGASELLAWLPRLRKQRDWVIPAPSYGEYRRAVTLAHCNYVCPILFNSPDFQLDHEGLSRAIASVKLPPAVILGHPNNPTGTVLAADTMGRLRRENPHSLWVLDESFGDFIDSFSSAWAPHLPESEAQNLIVIRSLTKIAAIPGLRLGYALAHSDLARQWRAQLPPWSVNFLAQKVGVRFFQDPDFVKETQRRLPELRRGLVEGLRRLPELDLWEPDTNWILARLKGGATTATELAQRSSSRGVALRPCTDFPGLGNSWLRISVRSEPENARIITTLSALLAPDRLGSAGYAASGAPPRARSIMLQGCSSDAGKSLLVTALCRCLKQDGYRVAPFKAQNMSNNSGVTADGGELGRAQVVQALACGIEPDTRMNPVLLKPTSDRGAQVVVRGKALGHRDVLGYLATKRHCLDTALASFDELAQDYDVIVCEGAGSAGEMNLRQADIVNMGFVAHRPMPVLLVGDIDRGGAYASFVGHMEVLDETDRGRVSGFIINRFRGDPSLLAPAHEWVERHTGRPILGVVPFLPGHTIAGEDRLSLESGPRSFGDPEAPITIAVVIGPHVSNATDIDPLLLEPDVHVRLVERPSELGNPDLVLLLGTKNTLADLEHFRATGLLQAIHSAHQQGSRLVGICGGLQMLGESILDPSGVESTRQSAIGLGLLPIRTQFDTEKVLRRTVARHVQSGHRVTGYEIHHGNTDLSGLTPILVDDAGTPLGAGTADHRVWGTYLHGVFDSDDFRRHFLDDLRESQGLNRIGSPLGRWNLDPTFDRLATAFRAHVDWKAIYRLMGLNP